MVLGMTRSRILKSKIAVILEKIKIEHGDEFESIQPFDVTSAQIYDCIKRLNEQMHGTRRDDVIHIENNTLVTRNGHITVRTQRMGYYDVLIDRKSLQRNNTGVKISPIATNYGIAKGASKIYKKGVLSFSLEIYPAHGTNIRLLNVEHLLSLSRKSLAHQQLLSSLSSSSDLVSPLLPPSESVFSPLGSSLTSSLFEPGSPLLTEQLVQKGFTPDLTGIVVKPKQSSPSALVHQVYVRDAGVSLNKLDAAATITQQDYQGIVDAMRRAGQLNLSLCVPFDVKPEHVFCATTDSGKKMTLIDSSYLSVTPLFLSESVTRFTGLAKEFAHTVFEISDLSQKNQKFMRTPYTHQECAYYVIADTIISTLAYIAAAKYLQGHTYDTLSKAGVVEQIARQALDEIAFIPRLFRSWPIPFKPILTQALMDAQNLQTRDWLGIFTHNFVIPSAFAQGHVSSYDASLWM